MMLTERGNNNNWGNWTNDDGIAVVEEDCSGWRRRAKISIRMREDVVIKSLASNVDEHSGCCLSEFS